MTSADYQAAVIREIADDLLMVHAKAVERGAVYIAAVIADARNEVRSLPAATQEEKNHGTAAGS